MRIVFLGSILALASLEPGAGHHAPPVAAPNDNSQPAGTLRDGVLTLSLEVKEAVWYPDGDTLPGRTVVAFAEPGKDPLTPGPLVRVPAGTEVRFVVSNPRGIDTLTFHVPAALHGGSAAATDSVIVPPGEQRELRMAGSAPGTYLYRARGNDALTRGLGIKDLLAGAVVVDPPGAGLRPRDRVLMLTQLTDTIGDDGLPVIRRTIFAINGRSWPHTERLAATVGDSVRWRLVNATIEVHPMHLHGFYFRVDQVAGPAEGEDSRESEGRMAVTHRMRPFSTASTTWVPERAGNWIFHCHFQIHVAPVDSGTAATHRGHPADMPHALTGMRGLVVGVVVSPHPGDPAAVEPAARRRLRLVAMRDPGGTDSMPSMRYVLDGDGTGGDSRRGGPGISLPLVLTRAEPVEITVVNRLGEPTAVHWHGIELESYFDGVPGFSGSGARLSPLIAPGDSFVARFTPPRAGTFMYHSHVDEPRTHQAGLVGALIIREPGSGEADDYSFVIKTARIPGRGAVVDINGQQNPDTIVVHAGRPVRLRFMNLTRANPSATVWLTARADSARRLSADSLVLRWRLLAKDGANVSEDARTVRLARQLVSMGETYDFEFTPAAPGTLRIEVRAAGGQRNLLGRVPIRVEWSAP